MVWSRYPHFWTGRGRYSSYGAIVFFCVCEEAKKVGRQGEWIEVRGQREAKIENLSSEKEPKIIFAPVSVNLGEPVAFLLLGFGSNLVSL